MQRDAGQRLLNGGNLPDTGGVPTSVIIRIDTDQTDPETHDQAGAQDESGFETGAAMPTTGPVYTSTGIPLTIETARRPGAKPTTSSRG